MPTGAPRRRRNRAPRSAEAAKPIVAVSPAKAQGLADAASGIGTRLDPHKRNLYGDSRAGGVARRGDRADDRVVVSVI
jgi:hypothetical protein